jgi:hypothetical protein
MTIFGFDEFVRTFGGLHHDYPLGYAVQDFFMNGGAQAVIVRLFKEDIGPDGKPKNAKSVFSLNREKSASEAAGKLVTAAADELMTPEKGVATADSVKAAIDTALAGISGDLMIAAATQIKTAADAVTGDDADAEKVHDAAVEALKNLDIDVISPTKEEIDAATTLVTAAKGEVDTPTVDPPTAAAVQAAIDTAFAAVTDPQQQAAAKNVKDAADAAAKDGAATPQTVYAAAANALEALPVPANFLQLEASFPGKWGNILTVSIDREGITSQMDSLYDYLTSEDLFNLEIHYNPIGGMPISERHINLSTNDDSADRRVDRVLSNESILVRVPMDGTKPILPQQRPDDFFYQAGGGYDSLPLTPNSFSGNPNLKTGMYALQNVDVFNLLCIPPDSRDPTAKGWNTDLDVYIAAAKFCVSRRAMVIMDPPSDWTDKAKMGKIANIKMTDLGNYGDIGRNAAIYFPRIVKADPMLKGTPGVFPACGMIAGIMATTDVKRGVWKAPAGVDAALVGAKSLELKLTDMENGQLNPQGRGPAVR